MDATDTGDDASQESKGVWERYCVRTGRSTRRTCTALRIPGFKGSDLRNWGDLRSHRRSDTLLRAASRSNDPQQKQNDKNQQNKTNSASAVIADTRAETIAAKARYQKQND